MKVIIVPGYGDGTKYIRRLTRNWDKRFDLQIYIHPFGSTDPPEQYEQNWQKFVTVLERERPSAIIGISFGFGIACRALIEHPQHVKKIVSIAGPYDLKDINPKVIHDKYPMLGKSLVAFDSSKLTATKIMTLRAYYDEVIKDAKVSLPGADNRHIPMIEHAASIVTALAVRGRTIATFLHKD